MISHFVGGAFYAALIIINMLAIVFVCNTLWEDYPHVHLDE